MLDMEAIKNFSIDKSDWQKVKFGDVVFEPKESVKNPVAEGIEHVVGLEHIDSGDMHLRRSENLDRSTTFTKKFGKGDVLFGRRRAYLKKAAKASFEGICSGDITVMRAKEELLLPELLPFIVNNDKFFDHAIKHSAGGLSPRVKFKDLLNYEFNLPPTKRQKTILDLLKSVDEAIQERLGLLQAYKVHQSIYINELLTGKKRIGDKESNFVKTELGLIPEDWMVKKLGEVCSLKGGKRIPKGVSLESTDNGLPYLRVTDMTPLGVTTDNLMFVPEEVAPKINNYRISEGDLYISVAGTLGLVGAIPAELDGAYLTENADKLTDIIINKSYLMYYMRSSKISSQIKSVTTVSTQPKLALTRLREFWVAVPPKNEQVYIAHQIYNQNKISEEMILGIQATKAVSHSIINQVF